MPTKQDPFTRLEKLMLEGVERNTPATYRQTQEVKQAFKDLREARNANEEMIGELMLKVRELIDIVEDLKPNSYGYGDQHDN